MKAKIGVILGLAVIIVAIWVGTSVPKIIPFETLFKGREESVSLAMLETRHPEDYIGKPAGDDIPRIEDVKTWEDTLQGSYMTIEPVGIISTGIGTRHPWVSVNSPAFTLRSHPGLGNANGNRVPERPDVINMDLDLFAEYAEYYILQLPDQSYILAQMSVDNARRIMAGNEITLPVGRKSYTDFEALSLIRTLCEQYNVNTDGVFYCIDDKWNEDHSLLLLLVRGCLMVVITIAVGAVLIKLIEKIKKIKKPKRGGCI